MAINQTECDMLGYDRAEMLGRSILDFVTEEYREVARASLVEKLRGDRPLAPFRRPYLCRGRPGAGRLDRGAAPVRRRGADRRPPDHDPGPHRAAPDRIGPGVLGAAGAGPLRGDRGRHLRPRPRRPHPRRQPGGLSTTGLYPRGIPDAHDLRRRRPRVLDRLRRADSPADRPPPHGLRGPPQDQRRAGHPGRHQHLDDPARGSGRRPGGLPRHHRAQGPGRSPPAIRGGRGPERPRHRGEEPRPPAVGGPLPEADRGVARRRGRGRRRGPDHPLQPGRRADLRLLGRGGPGPAAVRPDADDPPRPRGPRAGAPPRGRRDADDRPDRRAVGPPQGRRGVPARALAQLGGVRGGDPIHRLDPRPDRASADEGDARPVGEARLDRPAQRRGGPRDQQSPGLRREQPGGPGARLQGRPGDDGLLRGGPRGPRRGRPGPAPEGSRS